MGRIQRAEASDVQIEKRRSAREIPIPEAEAEAGCKCVRSKVVLSAFCTLGRQNGILVGRRV